MSMTVPVQHPLASKLPGALTCGVLLAGCVACGSTVSDPVQKQWESREPSPSCGSLRLQQDEAMEDVGTTELACLQRALDSRRAAELTVRYLTTEGDPVINYYRVTPTGSTEKYTDATQDAFSDRKWRFASCDRPSAALDVSC